eukprot:TRINITY_DN1452_c0_g1_i1.p1 TRINITY_DN1452_c0_g1~~TRINITY_DN1452_c0_g1_i1.p1  ORF type:complete len:519 (+),score=76.55 TRINITY_DN1452_c0_g1_i1:63-1619(+)
MNITSQSRASASHGYHGSAPNSAMKGYAFRQDDERHETLATRREKLSQKQKAWKRDVEEDPELAAFLADEYLDLNNMPSALELSMLHQSLTGPGNESATGKQLIQLLHSPDPSVALFALRQIIERIDNDDLDVGHLAGALRPLVKIILRREREGELYWAVLVVLQMLSVEDRHAMAIGDMGGAPALVELLDVPRGTTTINAVVISNILNAIWLICCYEGNGDLSSYSDEKGPILSILNLLTHLREESTASILATNKILKQEMLQTFSDLGSNDDPILVLLTTIEKLSLLKAYRGHITAAGGIEHCVPLLLHSKTPHRVISGEIIRNLMVDNSLEFVVLEGVQKGVGLLTSSSNVEVMTGLRLFLHLYKVRGDLASLAGDMVSSGCLSICCELLLRESSDIPSHAVSLLALICKHGQEDYSFLLSQEPGMIQGIVQLLFSKKTHTLQHATAIFWYLTRITGTHQLFINSGSIPVLQQLLKYHDDPIVRHNILGSLEKIECFDDLGQDFFAPPHESSIHW